MQPVVDYVRELCAAEGLEQCFAALERAVVRLGFDGLVYSSYLLYLKEGASPVLLRSEGFDASFLKHYVEAEFSDRDFTIKRILQGDLKPIDWWREDERGVLEPEERTVIEVARHDYGLCNGVSIPTLSNKEEIAGASLVSRDKGPLFSKLLDERIEVLRNLVRLFHDRIHSDPLCRKSMMLEHLSNLSDKERKILEFLATGRPLKNIDGEEVTPAYANKLLTGLCQRLGADNRQQLRYILGLYRIHDLWDRE
ncbi:autoinducer binding domain-containing protein [Imhoffiella purpurea]|uniref:Transcription factor LuxR-like autoinducer-binding domain-containing protein n=1 Tax=Imhoffiella purpurea TaxID=1249627 RepID=W9V8V1_9GAMM|nr:autoinducer binding domain-containing protein [Imhoffiella purpurea]EXJ13301.1 hypothetical protein D779_3892 [Imhoffiella purpurea]